MLRRTPRLYARGLHMPCMCQALCVFVEDNKFDFHISSHKILRDTDFYSSRLGTIPYFLSLTGSEYILPLNAH